MKKPRSFQIMFNTKKIAVSFASVILFLIIQPVYAEPASGIRDILRDIQAGLDTIVPIIAGIILLCLLIGYLFRLIKKSTFIRWAISIIIAGLAYYITNLLFHIA
ncbi:TrbC/VirB2 family protein [Bartonella sp. F02]|uniref:TrbC/VirB2 family protein n=1 Tax=Bartonella sp. F02 TaxID=2967262 RepID=UPI0022A98029|nr:TrbC/VirB2 family protein [Bartonella sp. F02]MCZ2328770.1 TrbC/VirB2 family protein [Bartonella sp. F02]